MEQREGWEGCGIAGWAGRRRSGGGGAPGREWCGIAGAGRAGRRRSGGGGAAGREWCGIAAAAGGSRPRSEPRTGSRQAAARGKTGRKRG